MFQNNKYILYTKDAPILALRCDRDEKGDPHFVSEREWLTVRPFGFKDFDTWIAGRRAPQNREHIKELLTKCGCNDLEGYIRFSYAASLNDTFWIKPEESELTWDDISLYKNKFDENIARLAFGTGVAGEKFSSATPELSTDGSFPKCWKRFENEIFLLKQGSSGYSNSGLEPYSEFYAFQISKIICDDVVPYDLIRHHGKLVSRCKLFTTEDTGYAPAAAFMGATATLDDMFSFFDKLGSGNLFRQMVVLDALTLNTDRHLKNFGVLYDNDSMKILRMSPVFDNNLSLCPYASLDELRDAERYMSTRPSAIGDGFNEAALKCMTGEIRDRVWQVQNFKFDCSGKYALPEERIVLLERIVHMQAENLLKGRVISVPVNTDAPVEMVDLCITINKADNSEDLISTLNEKDIAIGSFRIITTTGDNIRISKCDITVNNYDDKIEIDIYDCISEGMSTSLSVKQIDGLCIYGKSEGKLIAAKVEIQLNKDAASTVTELERMEIELKQNQEIST